MAAPIPLPADARVTAIRGLIALMKKDHNLHKVVRTWRTWDGTPGEGDPPIPAQCPWLRLTFAPEPTRRFEAQAAATEDGRPIQVQPVMLTIETAVNTTSVSDSVLLWAAIEAALYRDEAALQAVGISRVDVRVPAWGGPDAGSGMTLAVGDVELTIFIRI